VRQARASGTKHAQTIISRGTGASKIRVFGLKRCFTLLMFEFYAEQSRNDTFRS